MTRRTCAVGLCVWMFLLELIPVPFIPSMSRCAFADSFNMKTEAWELTYSSVTTGMLMPPEMLERMPPERRAKLEETMRAREEIGSWLGRKTPLTAKPFAETKTT